MIKQDLLYIMSRIVENDARFKIGDHILFERVSQDNKIESEKGLIEEIFPDRTRAKVIFIDGGRRKIVNLEDLKKINHEEIKEESKIYAKFANEFLQRSEFKIDSDKDYTFFCKFFKNSSLRELQGWTEENTPNLISIVTELKESKSDNLSDLYNKIIAEINKEGTRKVEETLDKRF